MTGTGTDGSPVATVQPAAELFTRSAGALWATTYSVDLALVSEFLLPRLGDPPLNTVVLADHRRLAASLARIPPEREDTLATVNRRWLLRGISVPGAFHPKSYLAVTGSRATLLVGSGNLTVSGFDEGREAFTVFRSGTLAGDSALAIWTEWARRLVETTGDTALAERFADLRARPPVAAAERAPGYSPLLHNLDVPIVGQLAAAVGHSGERVGELLLAAPFYDAEAAAVGILLDTFRPHRVQLFMTRATSVNGEHLARRLTDSGARVTVTVYEPDQFVHAKFVGIVARGRAWALSGSANLSRAALTLTPGTHGNVELAVLAPMDPDELRAVFVPPGTGLAAAGLGELAGLAFRSAPEPDEPLVRLLSATVLRDGHVAIRCDPLPSPDSLLDDSLARQPVTVTADGGCMSSGPLGGRLVHLVAPDGRALSNRIVVDDPAALNAVLTGSSSQPDADRPPELTSGDLDSPLGQVLTWLHQHFVMDVSERADAAGTGGTAGDETEEATDDTLWERLEREKLGRDPRAAAYAGIFGAKLTGSPPLIELLEALRARVPSGTGGQSLLSVLTAPVSEEPGSGNQSAARRWAPATRIRVRARNLLRRWAAAQTDPRLQWVDPLAPAGNFIMVTTALACLRLDRARDLGQVELTGDDLDTIWQHWLRVFAGTGEGDGWLDQPVSDTVHPGRELRKGDLPEIAAALTWLVIRPGTEYRERVIGIQAPLNAALDYGLIEPTAETARYLTAVTGTVVTRDQVDDDLLAAAGFIDDDLWCAQTAGILGLRQLKLLAPPGADAIAIRLDVSGIADPLRDPRMPRLITAVRRYRGRTGAAVWAEDGSWRLSAVERETVAYRSHAGAAMAESLVPFTFGAVDSLVASDGVLADLFPAENPD